MKSPLESTTALGLINIGFRSHYVQCTVYIVPYTLSIDYQNGFGVLPCSQQYGCLLLLFIIIVVGEIFHKYFNSLPTSLSSQHHIPVIPTRKDCSICNGARENLVGNSFDLGWCQFTPHPVRVGKYQDVQEILIKFHFNFVAPFEENIKLAMAEKVWNDKSFDTATIIHAHSH